MAVQRAASRRGPQGRSVLGPADGLHLQRHLRWRAARRRTVHRGTGQRLLVVPLADPRRPHQPLRPRHAAVRRLRLQAAHRATGWASTGRSATKTSRRTTTRRRHSSASSAASRTSAARRTVSSTSRRPLRAHDTLVQRSCAKLNIRAVPARQAVTTSPRNGRPGCHYCGQCGRGCMTASNYASSYVQIFPAMKTGRVQVLANAMARELITDATGKVTAVSYIDKTDGTEKQVRCRTVVLSASACESSRLLLNSKSSRHPQGLANSSGTVGRYLMDTVGSSMSASVPALSGMPHYNSDGYGSHLYVPWWGWDNQQAARLPARLPHRSRRRLRHAGHRLVHGRREPHRGLRREDEAGDPRRVRHLDQPRGPRRDDSQRAVLLRDRSRREGSLGDPRAAVPLGLERSRAQPGPAHADDVPRDSRGAGRTGGDAAAGAAADAAARLPTPIARRSRAAARSSTRSARYGWATIRRRARSTSTARRTR